MPLSGSEQARVSEVYVPKCVPRTPPPPLREGGRRKAEGGREGERVQDQTEGRRAPNSGSDDSCGCLVMLRSPVSAPRPARRLAGAWAR